MEYILIRSARKTIGIYITDTASVEVRAPKKLSETEIDKIVKSKAEWIEKHLNQRRLQLEKSRDFDFAYGSEIMFRGEKYKIVSFLGKKTGFEGNVFYLPENLNFVERKEIIISVYKKLALQFLKSRTAYYAEIMNVRPSSVRVNDARKRWGSCSGQNRLNFSWRLVMGDDDMTDYVVVHELSHIKQHNHGKAFWKEVENVLPDYREREKKLKELSRLISEQNWS